MTIDPITAAIMGGVVGFLVTLVLVGIIVAVNHYLTRK